MLVLTRRRGEEIVIGDQVVITVVESHKDSVRLGISAPKDLTIRRGELLEQPDRERLGLEGQDLDLSRPRRKNSFFIFPFPRVAFY
ncbi:carbon storage regulator [Varibaculum cambriense]|nr:carbon storage regulator [Varibaculum cambriense]